MNLILEKSKKLPWYTDMAATLSAMDVDVAAYDWYISDIETNITVPMLVGGDVWLTGSEFSTLLNSRIQFIWAVFSAVPLGTRMPIPSQPYAEGNPTFWQPPEVRPQLPGASFEVVCVDSAATILVGVTEEIAARFSKAYPDAKLLSSTWS